MFRKILIFCSLLLVSKLGLAANFPSVTIGIVVPIQHQALNEIVAGFENEGYVSWKK